MGAPNGIFSGRPSRIGSLLKKAYHVRDLGLVMHHTIGPPRVAPEPPPVPSGPSRMPSRKSTSPHKASSSEAREIEQRSAPITPVIYEVVRRVGEEEMSRPTVSLWWSGVAAGLSISFSLLAESILRLRVPDGAWEPLLVGLGFPVGFLMVVLGRQQLFTENTITMVLPVMAQPTGANFRKLARVWSIVLVANLFGTLLAALFCTFTPSIADDVRATMVELSRHALDKGWVEMLFRGITAGFLMAAMVWLMPSADAAQFHVVAIMTYLIGISDSVHIVTGSVQAFMLLANGQGQGGALLAGFALPVLAGNIIGGTVLFAMISYAQVMKEIPRG
jgi:formate/nitrite transporter FocA (FNT family)